MNNKNNHLGNAFIFMVRYATARNTSADMATTTALKVWWEDIPNTHKHIIIEEIASGKDLYGYDAWIWNEFLKWATK